MIIYISKALLLSLSIAVFDGCDKDDDDDDNNDQIVEKKGIVINGAQEVPAKTVDGSGTADVSYNKGTKVMNFTLNWTGLTGVPTGAHIHGTAARGANAGIKFDFFDAFPKTASGTYSSSVTVDNVNVKEDSLLAGFYYFNIHTDLNKGGEIRGQIEF
jgi:hypothetical protein